MAERERDWKLTRISVHKTENGYTVNESYIGSYEDKEGRMRNDSKRKTFCYATTEGTFAHVGNMMSGLQPDVDQYFD